MTWAMLIAMVIKFLGERYAVGFPLLVALLKLFGIDIQKAADEDNSPITVGDAPDDLKNVVLGWFEKLRDNSNRLVLKSALTLLMRYIPGIMDSLWDGLFQSGHVSRPLSDFPSPVSAAADEAAILAD